MSALQIRNVPDDVHRTLKARAASQGQSLSEYAMDVLVRAARQPTIEEFSERLRLRGPAGRAPTDLVVDLIRSDRSDHDEP